MKQRKKKWVPKAILNDGRPESYYGTLTDCVDPDWGGSLAVLKKKSGETVYASFKACDQQSTRSNISSDA